MIGVAGHFAATATPAGTLHNFGHDTYAYPLWVQAQQAACICKPAASGRAAVCANEGSVVSWRDAVPHG